MDAVAGAVETRRRRRAVRRAPDPRQKTLRLLRAGAPALVALAAYCVLGIVLAVTFADLTLAGALGFFATVNARTFLAPPATLVAWMAVVTIADPAKRSVAAFKESFGPEKRARLVAGFVFVAAIYQANCTYSLLKRMMPIGGAFPWDVTLADLDRRLHFGADVWTYLHGFIEHPVTRRIIELNYAVGWTTYALAIVVWVCFDSAFDKTRNRFLVLYLTVLAVVGNGLAKLFLSAGPIFYHLTTGDAERFAPLTAYVDGGTGLVFSGAEIRNYLWELFQTGRLDIGTGISAFPSVHVGLATFAALVIAERSRKAARWAWGYAFFILLSSVYLGWHYAIDGYVAAAVVLLANAVLKRVERRWWSGEPA